MQHKPAMKMWEVRPVDKGIKTVVVVLAESKFAAKKKAKVTLPSLANLALEATEMPPGVRGTRPDAIIDGKMYDIKTTKIGQFSQGIEPLMNEPYKRKVINDDVH